MRCDRDGAQIVDRPPLLYLLCADCHGLFETVWLMRELLDSPESGQRPPPLPAFRSAAVADDTGPGAA
jgi:hypothetical protein